jgi:hypothetical protein
LSLNEDLVILEEIGYRVLNGPFAGFYYDNAEPLTSITTEVLFHCVSNYGLFK